MASYLDNFNYRDNINNAFKAQGMHPYFSDTTTPITPAAGFTMGADGQPVAPTGPVTYQRDMIAPQYAGGGGMLPQAAPAGNPSGPAMQRYQQSPYLMQQIQGLQTQFNNNLQRNIIPGLQSGAVATGGVGGSKEAIAEGLAAGESATGFANAATNLLGQDYTNSMNRNLQQYQGDQQYMNQRHGIDTAQILGMTNAANNRHATDVGYNLGTRGQDLNYGLGTRGQDLSYDLTSRGLDQSGVRLGSDLFTQSLKNDWIAPTAASEIYRNFTGFGTNNSTAGGDFDWARFLGNTGSTWDFLNKK